MKTALIVIATGEKYWQYILPLIRSAARFFPPHEVCLFTDCPRQFVPQQKALHPYGFPGATLYRYHAIVDEKWLYEMDQVFYVDVDSIFVNEITEDEICSEGITATRHGGYLTRRGTHETRPESTAYVSNPDAPYYCGGFVGGETKAFMAMARQIQVNVDIDTAAGITAVWHDESYLNRYLFDHPPAKVLSPSFNYPDEGVERYEGMWGRKFTPKIVCLTKGWR